MASIEIHSIDTVSGNQPRIARRFEAITQTFKAGVPVQVSAAGGIQEWDGVTVAAAIAGFSKTYGKSLATLGQPANIQFAENTFGSVPNQSSAVNVSHGTPFNDGKTPFEVATADTEFYGQVNPAGNNVANTDLGKAYGLTKDTDGHWYVDKTKVGAAAVVRITRLDPIDTTRGVYFVVLPAAANLTA